MFDGNLHYPRLVHIFLPILESFWNHEDFPMKFSVTVIQNFSTEKRDIPFSHPYKLFAARRFLKHRKSSQRKFSLVWDQKFSTEELDILLASKRCFRCQKLCEKGNWTQRKFSVMWDKKNQPKNLISPSLIKTNFSLPHFSWNNEELPMKDFETLIQKNCDRKTWYPPASSKQYSRYQIFCETPRCSQCTFSVNGDKNCLTEFSITPVFFLLFFP